jgi:hypothetical protein
MQMLPLHRQIHDPSRRRAARFALPVAGVIAGTVAGVAVAAAIRRSGLIGPESFELAPAGSSLEFDKGGVWVSQRLHASEDDGDGGDAGGPDADAGEVAGLEVTGIRPTFPFETELRREVEALTGLAPDAVEPRGREPEVEREPVLSAPRG